MMAVIAPQSRRSFPEKIDFRTSPGHLEGGDARHRLGLPGAGPVAVITQLATYGFTDGEMELRTLHPGVRLEDVRANLGWEPRVTERLEATPPPSAEELRLLRELENGDSHHFPSPPSSKGGFSGKR